MGFANFNYWPHYSLLYFSNSVNTLFLIHILLQEVNWSDHRPKFKATVNFNGEELLASSFVEVYLNLVFYVYLKILGLILLCISIWVLSLWFAIFCIFSCCYWL